MRTNEERIHLIHERTAQKRRDAARRRHRALCAACMAACLWLVAGAGALMPALMAHATGGGAAHISGAASLIGDHAALGYILMGLLAFLLGVCVTVFLYRLRRREERRRREEDSDEL